LFRSADLAPSPAAVRQEVAREVDGLLRIILRESRDLSKAASHTSGQFPESGCTAAPTPAKLAVGGLCDNFGAAGYETPA